MIIIVIKAYIMICSQVCSSSNLCLVCSITCFMNMMQPQWPCIARRPSGQRAFFS